MCRITTVSVSETSDASVTAVPGATPTPGRPATATPMTSEGVAKAAGGEERRRERRPAAPPIDDERRQRRRLATHEVRLPPGGPTASVVERLVTADTPAPRLDPPA